MDHRQHDFASTDPGVKLGAGTGAQSSYKESSLFHNLDASSAFSEPVAAAFGKLDSSSSLCQFADFMSLSIDPGLLSNLDWGLPDTQELFAGTACIDPFVLGTAYLTPPEEVPPCTPTSDEVELDEKLIATPSKTTTPGRPPANKKLHPDAVPDHPQAPSESHRPRLRTASRRKKTRMIPKEPPAKNKKTGTKTGRTSHNDVEKNYRTRLGIQFQRLLDALPVSSVEGVLRMSGAVGAPGEIPRPVDVSRAEVLQMAWSRIKVLEEENEALLGAKGRGNKDVLARLYEVH